MSITCDRCHAEKESVCPCTVTVVHAQTSAVGSPLDPRNPAGAQVRIQLMPFMTTVFLCQECNAVHLARELREGPFGIRVFAEWLAEGNEEQDPEGPRLVS